MNPIEFLLIWSLMNKNKSDDAEILLNKLTELSLSCLKGKKKVHPDVESVLAFVVWALSESCPQKFFDYNVSCCYIRADFIYGEFAGGFPIPNLPWAIFLEFFAEDKINFTRGNQIDGSENEENRTKRAEQIVIDVSNAVINTLPKMTKGEHDTFLWIRINFLSGRYDGGSVFWMSDDDFIRADQNKAGKNKGKTEKGE